MPKALRSDHNPADTAHVLLEEAKHLFAEHGFDGVSINDIAAAAGVSKATVFHHFGSKQQLYLEVMKTAMSCFEDLAEHLKPERAPIRERLQSFLEAHARYMQEHPNSSRVVLREMLDNHSELTQELAEGTARNQFKLLLRLLEEVQQSGEIRADVDLAALAVMIISTDLMMFQSRALLEHLPEVHFNGKPEQTSRLLADILLNGITQGATSS